MGCTENAGQLQLAGMAWLQRLTGRLRTPFESRLADVGVTADRELSS